MRQRAKEKSERGVESFATLLRSSAVGRERRRGFRRRARLRRRRLVTRQDPARAYLLGLLGREMGLAGERRKVELGCSSRA